MRILVAFILLMSWCVGATTYTEFYCDTSNGSTNINAGSTTNATPVYSSVNGNWDGTSVYTPTDGSTPANTVSAGMWAAIFIDGSTNLVQTSAGGCVMLITNVAAGANGAITFERSAFMGTAPSSSATGRSINVGGCWNGPYGTIGFPFGFAATTGTNGPQAMPRINLRNTAQYNITAAITHANAGPVRFQGMTSTAADGGSATIDGGATGTSYVALAITGANTDLVNFIFQNNGNSGSAGQWLSINAASCLVRGVIVHDTLRNGITIGSSAAGSLITEVETYNCNKANNSGSCGILNSVSTSRIENCISHDNSGSVSDGFSSTTAATMLRCVSYNNPRHGFYFTGQPLHVFNCDSYNNTGSGLHVNLATISFVFVKNSNFLKNGSHGITNTSSIRSGEILNCGFGSGTMANSGVNVANLGAINEIGSLTYSADTYPWTDPTTGNFAIEAGAQARAAGRGMFPTNTVSYPDIGAAQSASTNSATASGGAYTWAQ